MRCLVFAYSEIGVVGLESLLDGGQDVVGVVTHQDNPWEFKWFRSVEELAIARGIPVIKPEDPNTPEVLAWAREREPEVVFSFYYRQMLKAPLLALGRLGAFNLHGSLLPKFRGRAPVNWAIIEGATETGVTLHEMVAKPDAGFILAQRVVPIGANETAQDVFAHLVPQARALLDQVVPQIAQGIATRTPQDTKQATYFGGRKPEDGALDWTWPAQKIHNMVRALTRPYPGAFTQWEGRKLLIWSGRIAPEIQKSATTPGTILSAGPDGVLVATGAGVYRILEVQYDEDPAVSADRILKQGSFFERSRS
jgi:methionyl-tRNA formyltransferase